MSRLTRDGTAEPVSRDQIFRHERGQGNIQFPCLADHVQDWQPDPVDPYSCYMCDHSKSSTTININNNKTLLTQTLTLVYREITITSFITLFGQRVGTLYYFTIGELSRVYPMKFFLSLLAMLPPKRFDV